MRIKVLCFLDIIPRVLSGLTLKCWGPWFEIVSISHPPRFERLNYNGKMV